jgi:hypothetical protein
MCSILEKHEFIVAMTGLLFAMGMIYVVNTDLFNDELSTADWGPSITSKQENLYLDAFKNRS